MCPEPQQVAVRLGFDEPTIRRLEARGHLCRLAQTESEIRARLYYAYLAHLRPHADGQKRKERLIRSALRLERDARAAGSGHLLDAAVHAPYPKHPSRHLLPDERASTERAAGRSGRRGWSRRRRQRGASSSRCHASNGARPSRAGTYTKKDRSRGDRRKRWARSKAGTTGVKPVDSRSGASLKPRKPKPAIYTCSTNRRSRVSCRSRRSTGCALFMVFAALVFVPGAMAIPQTENVYADGLTYATMSTQRRFSAPPPVSSSSRHRST